MQTFSYDTFFLIKKYPKNQADGKCSRIDFAAGLCSVSVRVKPRCEEETEVSS